MWCIKALGIKTIEFRKINKITCKLWRKISQDILLLSSPFWFKINSKLVRKPFQFFISSMIEIIELIKLFAQNLLTEIYRDNKLIHVKHVIGASVVTYDVIRTQDGDSSCCDCDVFSYFWNRSSTHRKCFLQNKNRGCLLKFHAHS